MCCRSCVQNLSSRYINRVHVTEFDSSGRYSCFELLAQVLRQHVETRFAQNTRLLNTTKAELEVKLVGLETRFNRCNDELWGEEPRAGWTRGRRNTQQSRGAGS